MNHRGRIIVAGAGPGGLTAGLCLAAAGVPVTVCEAGPSLAVDLRAGSYHPPTLEMLAPHGVTDTMLAAGIKARCWQVRDRKLGLVGEFDLGLLKDETPYPYRLHLEQHKLTPILLAAAERHADFDIRFDSRVVAAEQDADGVTVTVERDGEAERIDGGFLIGADGHHSVVRDTIGVEFEGFTWPEAFLISSTTDDFGGHGYAYATYIADPDEWVMLFKMPGDDGNGLWRMALPTDPNAPREETCDPDTVQARIQGFQPRTRPYNLVHVNIYRVHQRVAETFNKGRMAIVGDAAHVNNPLGAMGLNGAVHDAVNLADKLIAIQRGAAGPELLDLYTRQRRPPQIEFVQRISIRNMRLIEERDPKVRVERQAEIRVIAEDPARAYDFLMDTSMINMVRQAATIT